MARDLDEHVTSFRTRQIGRGPVHAHRNEHQTHDEVPKLPDKIVDCDAKIARSAASLDAGGDIPTLVTGWISESTAIKKAAQAGPADVS